MTIYRTNGPWGSGIGVNLTPAQVDTNFYELRSDLDDVIANPPTADSIISVTQNGLSFTFHTTLGNTLGPLQMPYIGPIWRGEWAPFTLYSAADQFKVTDVGIFIVLVDHTSAGSFDPLATGGSPAAQLYLEIIEVSTSHAVSTKNADYTLVLSDADGWIRLTSFDSPPSVITVMVPSSVDFAIGTTVAFEDTTGGGVDVVGDGVTINVPDGALPSTGGQYAVIQIKKVAADEWTVYGNLAF